MPKSRYYKMIASAMLIAVSILLTRLFAGNFLVLGVPAARFSLGFLPIMLAGVLLGPGWGAVVGLIADALGFFLFPNGVYFPPIATTSMLAHERAPFLMEGENMAPEGEHSGVGVAAAFPWTPAQVLLGGVHPYVLASGCPCT